MPTPGKKRTIRPAALEWLGDALKLHEVLDEKSALEQVLESLPAITLEVWPAGQEILAEGEQGADFSVIDSGKASAWRERDLPRPRKLGTLQVGDFFGEISFLMKAARSATVRAETDCTAFRFPSSEFEELLRKHANMRKWVNTVVRERLIGSAVASRRSSVVPIPGSRELRFHNSSFAGR